MLREQKLKKQTACCGKSVSKTWQVSEFEGQETERTQSFRAVLDLSLLVMAALRFITWNSVMLMEALWLWFRPGYLTTTIPCLVSTTPSLTNRGIFYYELRLVLTILLSTGPRTVTEQNWCMRLHLSAIPDVFFRVPICHTLCTTYLGTDSITMAGMTCGVCIDSKVCRDKIIPVLLTAFSFHVITCQVGLLMYFCDAQEFGILLLAAPPCLVPR